MTVATAEENPAVGALPPIGAEADTQGGKPSSSPRVIEEIVVTAQKIEQSVQDVPISMNVLSGEQMRDAGVVDLKGLEAYVPLVRVEPDASGPVLTLRGFGTYGVNEFESSVGLVVDDIFLARPPFILDAFFDLDRIEVLRGPQGTVFGKNSPAGVFHLVTAEPTDEFSGTIGAYTGNLGERRAEVAVGGPITKTLGVRLAYLYADQDKFVFNTFLRRQEDAGERQAGRMKLRWRPTDDLEIEGTAMRSVTDMTFWGMQTDKLEPATRDYLDDFDPRIEDDPFNFQTSEDAHGFVDLKTSIVTGRATYSLGDVWRFSDLDLTAVYGRAAYDLVVAGDSDVSPADLLPGVNDRSYSQDTVELRANGGASAPFGLGDSLAFVAGVYLFRASTAGDWVFTGGKDLPSYLATEDALETVTNTNQTVPAGPAVLDQVAASLGLDPKDIEGAAVNDDKIRMFLDQHIESESLFGQVTWNFTPKLSVTGGARANQERREGFFRNTKSGTPGLVAALFSFQEFEARRMRREVDVAPKANLQYHWTDDITTFFTWAKGYKSGGFNALSFTPEGLEFGPESSSSYEIGAKARFLDGTLRVNTALFRTSFNDLQVQVFDGVRFFVFNAANATSQGIEGDFLWLAPWEPLQVSGSIGWIDAAYGKGSFGPAPVFSPSRTQDLEGKALFMAPELTWTLSPAMLLPLGRAPLVGPVDLKTVFDVLYTGNQFVDVDADPNAFQKGYLQLNSQIGFAGSEGGWSIAAQGKNLTDTRYKTEVLDAILFPGTYDVRQGAGRRIGVNVTVHW